MHTLYLVSTPIGNLEDISLRALRLLGEVSLVAAEDTRTTRKLLTRHGIRQRLLSYNEHNMRTRTPVILAALEEGDVALVTEAGTPAISDPGYELVLAALAAGAQVSPVPGPSAVLAALAVSGLPAREFTFLGFPPRRSKERRELLASLAREARTLVFFESPHRVLEMFNDMEAVLGDRRLAVCRELTKTFEEVFRGTVSQAKSHFREPRGEFTLVVEGASLVPVEATDDTVLDHLQRRLSEKLSLRDAVGRVSQELNVTRRRVYELGLQLQRKRPRKAVKAADPQCPRLLPHATIPHEATMPEKIFLGVAWPYSNGSLHIGQIVGAYLPADIFARYHRAAGNDVLMVSGSDQHGTPITVRAEQEKRTPAEVATQFHREFMRSWHHLGISWDLFTTTGTENHARVVQDIFMRLYKKGDIYLDTMRLPYCNVEDRFLLDRYVEGICPTCEYQDARGDQCDRCGSILDPEDLREPRCKFDGSEPEMRESEHFFLRLSGYNDRLTEWLSSGKEHWRKNVLNFSLGILKQGLRDRSISRDLDWGIPVPVPGYEHKRIYVWFEAVIGYLSASIEWAERIGEPERWRDFWNDPSCKMYYFIGKDNIPFHTLVWPAELMGYSEATGEHYNLPYDVPANQYLTIRGSKVSTSRRLAVWVPDYLSRYDPDPLRYYLSAVMPETSDSDFSWKDVVRRNNDELLATWGNLVNRVLLFTYRTFGRAVPLPVDMTDEDRWLVSRAEQAIAETGEHISRTNFRAGLESAMSAAREVNRYLEDNAPWKIIGEHRDLSSTILYTSICAISALKTAFYPYLPFSSQTIHAYLGNEGPVAAAGWKMQLPRPRQPIAEPKPLFKKLERSIIAEEEARLGI